MKQVTNNLLILKTDIQSENMVRRLEPVFNSHEGIQEWSIDYEDVDKVLRIESKANLEQSEVLKLISIYGFYAEELKN